MKVVNSTCDVLVSQLQQRKDVLHFSFWIGYIREGKTDLNAIVN